MTQFNKLIYIFLLLSVCLSADQLYLSKIVVLKGNDNEPEKIEIYNPTSESINLTNYYIANFSDFNECSGDIDGRCCKPTKGTGDCNVLFKEFIAGFPTDLIIESNQIVTVGLHDQALYEDYYGESTDQVLFLYTDMRSCSSFDDDAENENPSTIGIVNIVNPMPDQLKNSKGSVYLLRWDESIDDDGQINGILSIVDSLIWGSSEDHENPIRSFGEADPSIGNDSMYVRNNFTSDCDDASDFCSWNIDTIFKWGCADQNAKNYTSSAEKSIDCKYSIKYINNNINDFLNTNISLEGVTVVDYFDITVYNGPHAITIEDEYNHRLELTVWSDDWSQSKNYLLQPPFGKYRINVSGSINVYDGKTQLQSTSGSIEVVETINTDGIFTASEGAVTSINPSPFVLIPSRGETLQYSYSFPSNSRAIVSVYDLSGRFITTLFDKYHESPGTRESLWNGRDHLGQILNPGTYIMQIETIKGGSIETDFSPVVIGVQK